MTSRNVIRLKNSNKAFNNFSLRNTGAIKISKNQKNIFREYPKVLEKKIFYRKPNFYRSFINSSAPFNYYKNPVDKNTFLISYNGGPQNQLHSYITRDDLKNEMINRESCYQSVRPCGCLSKYYTPKISRNLSYNDLKYNDINNYENGQYNSCKNLNNFKKIPLIPNKIIKRNFSGLITPHHFRISNDGKIIYTLKKFRGIENKDNLRYEETKSENKNEIEKSRNLFNWSIYGFRPRTDKKFHKTQIFDHCKPYLTDEFQEFAD